LALLPLLHYWHFVFAGNGLPAFLEAAYKEWWEFRLHHLSLRGRNVVLSAIAQYGLAFFIVDGVGRARVAISWLAHAAGVDEQTALVERDVLFIRKPVPDAMVLIEQFEQERGMGMADEAVGRFEPGEVVHGLLYIQQVLP